MTEEIADDDALLRRVADNPDLLSRSPNGAIRPSSVSMKPHGTDGRLSVDVRRMLASPSKPEDVLTAHPASGLVEFRALAARDLELVVAHDPLPANRAHANITGFAALSRKQAKRVQRELAKAAVWIRMPAGALHDG